MTIIVSCEVKLESEARSCTDSVGEDNEVGSSSVNADDVFFGDESITRVADLLPDSVADDVATSEVLFAKTFTTEG